MKHDCLKAHGGTWSKCIVCDGRDHLEGCTSRKIPIIDCCEARHKALHNSGQTRGISDSSFFMWTPDFPLGVHYLDKDFIEKAKVTSK